MSELFLYRLCSLIRFMTFRVVNTRFAITCSLWLAKLLSFDSAIPVLSMRTVAEDRYTGGNITVITTLRPKINAAGTKKNHFRR